MNKMKYILSLLAVVANMLACDDSRNLPPPVDSSEPEQPSDNCSAYLKCAELCDDARCVSACEEVTQAPVKVCELERCSTLLKMCDEGNNVACAVLPECGGYVEDASSSESSASGESSGSSSSTSESGTSESSGDSYESNTTSTTGGSEGSSTT